jgi:spore germination protein YaaH
MKKGLNDRLGLPETGRQAATVPSEAWTIGSLHGLVAHGIATFSKRKHLRILFGVFIATFFASGLTAQFSAHQQQKAQFSREEFLHETDYDTLHGIRHGVQRAISKKCFAGKQVYGWHPAWSGTAYQEYDFPLLRSVGYFSYEVDPANGSYKTIHQWRESMIVEMAHQFGSQVELTASLFGAASNLQLLQNPVACQTLCDSLIGLVQLKKADGICIDFEGMNAGCKEPFVRFIDSLGTQLRRWRKDATLTLALYAVDWDGAFDIPKLVPQVDRFIVMAYDYHYAGSRQAGPVSPLRQSKLWGELSVESSLQHYLKAGVPKDKLLAGMPYYGYQWPVSESRQVISKAKGKGMAILLRDTLRPTQWDSASSSAYLPNGQAQVWIEDSLSLDAKYSLVDALDIAGIGIWALGYDHGKGTYWDLIKAHFADCGAANGAALAKDSNPAKPGMEGPTSAERNTWNWVWMIAGGVIAVGIIWAVKKWM